MHIVKRWHCDYCRKVLQKKSDMAKHEKVCTMNPASKSCGTCEFLRSQGIPSPDIPGVMIEVWVCSLDKINDADRTERNPDGLKRNCPYHQTRQYDVK